MWVIRGGDADQLVARFVEDGIIGLTYAEVPDAEILTRSEIRRSLAGDRTTAQLDADEAIVSAFVRELQVGESVLVPDTSRGEVVVGTVTGRYEFDSDAADREVRHRRTVDWLARHRIDDLPAAVRATAKPKLALQQHRDAEWSAYLAQIRDGTLGRDPKDRPARVVAAPRQRSARTAASTPRPKKPVLAMRTCASCFLQTHPDRMRGDHCVDCAG